MSFEALIIEVCHDVCVEPELQPLTGEQLDDAIANTQDGARLDIAANGLCGGSHERTFDVRILNPYAPLTEKARYPPVIRNTIKSRGEPMHTYCHKMKLAVQFHHVLASRCRVAFSLHGYVLPSSVSEVPVPVVDGHTSHHLQLTWSFLKRV